MESKTNWCVYMHENRFNGKKYIGVTGQKPTRRWQNGKHYDGNAHFRAAIQKYGWDGFKHEILYTELTQAEAERLETELIEKYRTTDPTKGYNLATGGGVNAGFRWSEDARARFSATKLGSQVTPEARAKMSAWHTGRHKSPETRAKMSAALMGNTRCLGRRVSPETREKLANQKRGSANPQAKTVVCVETGVSYLTMADAARSVCGNPDSISKACRGSLKTAYGYHWRYADEVVTAND